MTAESAPQTSRRAKALLLAGGLAVGGLLFELVGLGHAYLKTGELLYTRTILPETGAEIGFDAGRLDQAIVERLHPFFGFVRRPDPDLGSGLVINDQGFLSPYRYPYERRSDRELIIGVFGGSVAGDYAANEWAHGLLRKRLQSIPKLETVEPVVLSYAAGGYKQPQQLLILNYMLSIGQEIDLAINIDGFNEAALSFVNLKNGLDLTMPSFFHTRPLTELADNRLSDEMLQLTLDVGTIKRRILSARGLGRRTRSGAVHLVSAARTRLASRRLNQLSAEFVRLSQESGTDSGETVFHSPASPAELSHGGFGRRVARHWAESSILMHELLASRRIPYLHVLQPNQYFETGRAFGEAERKIAFSPDSSFRPGVEIGYPQLLKHAGRLENRGVAFLDGTRLFDALDEPAYADDCCHYTPASKELFADVVAEAVVRQLELRREEEGAFSRPLGTRSEAATQP